MEREWRGYTNTEGQIDLEEVTPAPDDDNYASDWQFIWIHPNERVLIHFYPWYYF